MVLLPLTHITSSYNALQYQGPSCARVIVYVGIRNLRINTDVGQTCGSGATSQRVIVTKLTIIPGGA